MLPVLRAPLALALALVVLVVATPQARASAPCDVVYGAGVGAWAAIVVVDHELMNVLAGWYGGESYPGRSVVQSVLVLHGVATGPPYAACAEYDPILDGKFDDALAAAAELEDWKNDATVYVVCVAQTPGPDGCAPAPAPVCDVLRHLVG